jgi:hypothetical protein
MSGAVEPASSNPTIMDPFPGLLDDLVADALHSFLLSLGPRPPPKRTGFNRESLDDLEVCKT